jgi:hypothetical protein
VYWSPLSVSMLRNRVHSKPLFVRFYKYASVYSKIQSNYDALETTLFSCVFEITLKYT